MFSRDLEAWPPGYLDFRLSEIESERYIFETVMIDVVKNYLSSKKDPGKKERSCMEMT